MTRDIKYLVLALALATAAVAPPTLRGAKDASGADKPDDESSIDNSGVSDFSGTSCPAP